MPFRTPSLGSCGVEGTLALAEIALVRTLTRRRSVNVPPTSILYMRERERMRRWCVRLSACVTSLLPPHSAAPRFFLCGACTCLPEPVPIVRPDVSHGL